MWETTNYSKVKEITSDTLYWFSLDSFKNVDYFITQNEKDYKVILWKSLTGEQVWKSEKLENRSCSIKVIEKYRKILVGLYDGGKCTVIKY